MVSEPVSTHCLSDRESMADQASPPSSSWDWDAMSQEERSRIEQKLDMLVEMVKSWNGYLSTAPASPTDAEIVCRGEATTGALPTAFGGLTSASDSSASLSSSSGIDASDLVVPIDASDLKVLAPTKCSTEGPSRNTCESGSPSVPEMVPTPPSATVDIISVLASTAASEEAVDGDAVTGVVSMPSADCMHHGTHEESLAVSLLFKTIPLWQSPSTPGPQRCVMRIPDEFIFELRPATMSCSALGRSVSIKLSDDVSLYGMLSDAFCMIREWVWLLQVPPRPPDASKSTGALSSVSLPFLPAPDPKPPWLLLGRELVGAYLRCELQKSTTYLNLDAAYTSFLCMVTQRTWYFDDEIPSINQWFSVIQGLQLVCAFLKNSLLKLLSNCSASALLMEICLEDDHMLKCKWGMQCLTLRTSAVCILNTVDQFHLKVAEPLHQLSNCCSVAQIGLHAPENLMIEQLIYEAHKGHIFIQFPNSNHCQDGANVMVEQFSFPVDGRFTPDAFRCGGEKHTREQLFEMKLRVVIFISSFLHGKGLARYLCSIHSSAPIWSNLFEAWFTYVLTVCTNMNLEKVRGSGELIQWPANILFSEWFPSNVYGSEISSIKRPPMVGFRAWTALDGKASQHWRILWDPGGYICALCTFQKWWTTPERAHVHCSEQLQWSSVLFVGESWIWLVAWDVDALEFSTGCGQAPFQERRNVTNQDSFFGQVNVNNDYYLAAVNHVLFSNDLHLDKANYFDPIYNNLKYNHEDYHGDLSELEEDHMPWDPGKSALQHLSKTSAWGQADFQEGGNVMTLACVSQTGPSTWAIGDGLGLIEPPGASVAIYTHREATRRPSSWITNETATVFSPLYFSLLLPLALFSVIPPFADCILKLATQILVICDC